MSVESTNMCHVTTVNSIFDFALFAQHHNSIDRMALNLKKSEQIKMIDLLPFIRLVFSHCSPYQFKQQTFFHQQIFVWNWYQTSGHNLNRILSGIMEAMACTNARIHPKELSIKELPDCPCIPCISVCINPYCIYQ